MEYGCFVVLFFLFFFFVFFFCFFFVLFFFCLFFFVLLFLFSTQKILTFFLRTYENIRCRYINVTYEKHLMAKWCHEDNLVIGTWTNKHINVYSVDNNNEYNCKLNGEHLKQSLTLPGILSKNWIMVNPKYPLRGANRMVRLKSG